MKSQKKEIYARETACKGPMPDLKELRAMLPADAQVVEFRLDATYLFAIKSGSASQATMVGLSDALRKMGIHAILVQFQDLRIFEFPDKPAP